MHYWPPCYCCRICITLNEIFAPISATLLTPVVDFSYWPWPASCLARAQIRSWRRDHICAVVVHLVVGISSPPNLKTGSPSDRSARQVQLAIRSKSSQKSRSMCANGWRRTCGSRLWPILVAREWEPVACCAHRVEVESSALGCKWWWWWWYIYNGEVSVCLYVCNKKSSLPTVSLL